ncbi:MAG: S8 family serine peptidase [Deltaproteobacteria bacterium]
MRGTIIESTGDEHVIRLGEAMDPLEAAQKLSTRPDVDYSEPDFVNIVPKLARRSSQRAPTRLDAFDRQQYAVHITRSVDAWLLVKGNKAIRIAVLDEGVDTLHEDLSDAVVGSFDTADNDTFQEPNPWDGHGTACAGLAAAAHNGIGVLGIGGGCSILAVRIAYSEKPGGDWIITNSGVARAINWSWRNGAAVLSNSWGGGAPSTAVSRAFERARTQGRDGKGCVVVIAAGNGNSAVNCPASLPNVVCVAASNEFDEPKTKTSHDGENWWGSSFGPEVLIAAPGVHNYTTDITGVAGYNAGQESPNYTPDFNGTSSATPIVAGAVGLVLSANPQLTEAEVRSILVETADKVGSVAYDAQGHNPRMGFGRLNVLEAVKRAQAMA